MESGTVQAHWPEEVRHYLTEVWGKPREITKLTGIKAFGGCYRIHHGQGSLILKAMQEPAEYLFYTEKVKELEQFRAYLPRLLWAYQGDDAYYIVLEDIPGPLSKERWQADPAVLKVLITLHRETWGRPFPAMGGYQPRWEPALTEALLKTYPGEEADRLRPYAEAAQKKAQPLFRPQCWLNGDTNPTNWGMRQDGTLVLFDWERFCCGSPAIDLGISMPGLGSEDDTLERRLAQGYLSQWPSQVKGFFEAEKELVEQVRLAKIWSAVEFLSNPPETLGASTLQGLRKGLAAKLLLYEGEGIKF